VYTGRNCDIIFKKRPRYDVSTLQFLSIGDVSSQCAGSVYVYCIPGWLEPLLDRIARDPTTVVCPVIDVIDDTTLEYHWRDSGGVNVGGFDWNLQVPFALRDTVSDTRGFGVVP
jgi:hypothetical protein